MEKRETTSAKAEEIDKKIERMERIVIALEKIAKLHEKQVDRR